jgi:hypothetical protein
MGYLAVTQHDQPPRVEVTDSGVIFHIGEHAVAVETGSTDADARLESYGQALTILGALGKSFRAARVQIAAEVTMLGSECEGCEGRGGYEITSGRLEGEWVDCDAGCNGSGRIPDFPHLFAQVRA